MGTNTIPEATGGNVIPPSDHNSLRSALIGNWVPRNSSAVATDLGGDLGTSSIRWKDTYSESYYIGDAANEHRILENGSDNISIETGGNQVAEITSDGITRESLARATIDVSNTIVTRNTSNTSTYQSLGDCTITTSNISNSVGANPVLLYIQSQQTTESLNDGRILLNRTSGDSASCYLRIRRTDVDASSTLTIMHTSLSVEAAGATSVSYRIPGFVWIDQAPTKNTEYIYDLQVKMFSGSIDSDAMIFGAVEL